MPLKEQTGKECFILTVALSVTGGFVMTTFPKKKINVPVAVRVMIPLNTNGNFIGNLGGGTFK